MTSLRTLSTRQERVSRRVAGARWSVGVAAGLALVLLVPARVAPAETQAEDAAGLLKLSQRERALVELGRRLFFDPALSAAGRRSCASCHDPAHGFSDPAVTSLEDFGRTPRHSQSLIDVDYAMGLHWDGAIPGVAAATRTRMSSPGGIVPYYGGATPGTPFTRGLVVAGVAEIDALLALLGRGGHAVRDLGQEVVATDDIQGEDVVKRLKRAGRYAEALRPLGRSASTTHVEEVYAEAVEAYVATIRSSPSPYDRFAEGEADALSASAARGLELFRGPAGCATCHHLEEPLPAGSRGAAPARATFRDSLYHNTGVSYTTARDTGETLLPSLSARAVRGGTDGDPGRAAAGGTTAELRAFKTPTLRDVARHPPYMHDASLGTLDAVVMHYAGGCGTDPLRDERLKGFACNEQDRHDLVAFLRALTSDTRPGLSPAPWKQRAERTRLRFRDARGERLVGLRIGLSSAGDISLDPQASALPEALVTDERGEILYEVPPCTHVALHVPGGSVPEGGSLVPDTCQDATIRLAVLGRVRVAMVLPMDVEPSAILRVYPRLDGEAPKGAVLSAEILPHEQVRVLDQPLVLERTSSVEVGGRIVALYEAPAPASLAPRHVFRMLGQTLPQGLALVRDQTVRVELRP